MTLFDSALQGATLEVETSVSPPMSFALDGVLIDDGAGPGLVMRALRPRVVLRRGAQVLYQSAPAGVPDPRVRAAVAAVALVLVSLLVLLLTTGRGRMGKLG